MELRRRALGYASEAKGAPLTPFEFDLGEVAHDDVVIRVSHCGVCMSDIDLAADKFGRSKYPMVLGHELVGVVEEAGSSVTHLKTGDRVGVGPIRGACEKCVWCATGRELYCSEIRLTAEPMGRGGFASQIRVSAGFAFRIPDSISSAEAAPLLCAGLTTYTPLRRWATAGERVGVLGVGGLGHLAVQFAHRMGLGVTTLALQPDEAERQRHHDLGADRVIDIGDPDAVASARGTIDLLVSTAYGHIDWAQLARLLRPEGKLCALGGSLEPISVPPLQLIHGAKAVVGSAAGTRRDMVEMLNFAHLTGVRPQIEIMPMKEINAAFERVASGAARYRVVLEVEG